MAAAKHGSPAIHDKHSETVLKVQIPLANSAGVHRVSLISSRAAQWSIDALGESATNSRMWEGLGAVVVGLGTGIGKQLHSCSTKTVSMYSLQSHCEFAR